MLIGKAVILLIGALALATSVAAQSTPPPPAITRTVIATTKLPTVTEAPLYFRAASVTLPPGEKSSVSAADGILYQISGSTEVAVDDQATTLKSGDGVFIPAGRKVTLTAGSGVPSTFLHFISAPATDLDRPPETAPAAVRELYRTSAAIPDLKMGGYDMNLTGSHFLRRCHPTRHTIDRGQLYISSSPTGSEHGGRQTEAKGPDASIYEPFSLVHQWGNPSSTSRSLSWRSISTQRASPPCFPAPPEDAVVANVRTRRLLGVARERRPRGSRLPVAFGAVPSQLTAMPAHRFRVGQTIVVSWSGPQVGIPLGPYVIVRLLPGGDGEPHYRVRSSVDGHERALLEVRSRHGRRDRRRSRLRRQDRRGGAGKGRVGRS